MTIGAIHSFLRRAQARVKNRARATKIVVVWKGEVYTIDERDLHKFYRLVMAYIRAKKRKERGQRC